MKHKYFSYCPEDGFDTHETLSLALLNAIDIIPNYLDEGWSEDVTGVCVGTITHRATMCDKVERAGDVDEDGYDTKGEHWEDPDWDYKCSYKMLPVKSDIEGVVSVEVSKDGSAIFSVGDNSIHLTLSEFHSMRLIFDQSAFFDIKRDSVRIAEHPAPEVAKLVEALEEIVNPVRFMRERLEEGEQLNGMVAVQLAKDAEYLKGIAIAALATHRKQGGDV